MNRHSQGWRELNAPQSDEPGPLLIWAGAALALLALWLITVFLFSL